MRQRLRVSSAILAAFAFVGCGESPLTVVPVSGTIEYNGAPVVGASVTFIADSGSTSTGRSANGLTDSSGKFTLTTYDDGDGAAPGDYKVTVTPIAAPPKDPYEEGDLSPDVVMEPMEDEYAVSESTEIPSLYADPATTTLTAKIGADGETDLKLTLE